MDRPLTLKELLVQHPEWADLPVVLYRNDGSYEWLGYSMTAYEADTDLECPPDEEENPSRMTKVLVISGN